MKIVFKWKITNSLMMLTERGQIDLEFIKLIHITHYFLNALLTHDV